MTTMTDEQAWATRCAAQNLAVVVRDEGPNAVRRAARAVLRAAGGDPVAALTAAATAICVDHGDDHWWERERTGPLAPHRDVTPCGTHAAYNRHKDHGEPVDDACGTAERQYQAARHRRRHLQGAT